MYGVFNRPLLEDEKEIKLVAVIRYANTEANADFMDNLFKWLNENDAGISGHSDDITDKFKGEWKFSDLLKMEEKS